MTTVVKWTGQEARALRVARRMSVRAFAIHLGVSAASVANWERRGIKIRLRHETQEILDRDLSSISDDVRQRFLATAATLPFSLDSGLQDLRHAQKAPDLHSNEPISDNEPVTDFLTKTAHESESLLSSISDGHDLDLLQEAVSQLGATYVTNPPILILKQCSAIRRDLLRLRSVSALHPGQLSDLYVAIARASGVLAYAALDLGDADSAATHSALVWRMAERAGDNELRAWGRGTQSLIARFNQEYVKAQLLAENGLSYAKAGQAKLRLIYGAAQSAANQGNAERTLELIRNAEAASEATGLDASDGIFGFPAAKQKYYAASSLIWLRDETSLLTAVKQASDAISIWQGEAGDRRIVDDEALAHIYLATAYLRLGEVDGAMEALGPVLQLPMLRRTSWMHKRLSDLRNILTDARFKNSTSVGNAQQKLQEFVAT